VSADHEEVGVSAHYEEVGVSADGPTSAPPPERKLLSPSTHTPSSLNYVYGSCSLLMVFEHLASKTKCTTYYVFHVLGRPPAAQRRRPCRVVRSEARRHIPLPPRRGHWYPRSRAMLGTVGG
jgi:hypothetical protein